MIENNATDDGNDEEGFCDADKEEESEEDDDEKDQGTTVTAKVHANFFREFHKIWVRHQNVGLLLIVNFNLD